jgi:hypothetical protein
MLIDISHACALPHPIFSAVLNNTKGINPEIFVSQVSFDQNDVMEKLREFI